MTREEASFLLANIDRRVCDDELNEALDMAIRSLEAWERVKADITEVEKAYGLDKATKYGNEDAEQQKLSYSTMMLYEVADLVDDIKEIIDKHLKEVEE